ncbi:MAG: UbiA prenyltransferase family protein [Promethearchaeota archaeon]
MTYRLKGLIALTRPFVLFTTSFFYIAAAFLSVNGIPPLLPLFIGFIAVVLAISAAHTLNDYFDRQIDKDNPRTAQRAIPTGLVSPRLALGAGVVYGFTAIALTFFLNIPSVILAFIAIPLPFAYNYMRNRKIPYSFLCTMLAVLFIILLGSTAASGMYLTNYGFLFVVFGISWEMGRTLISEVQDIDHDKESNITTISSTISAKHAAYLILLLFSLSASMSIILGFYARLGVLYLAIIIPTAIWLIYRSVELAKSPSTQNAIGMRKRAPKYLVIICLILIVSILLNGLLFGF